MSSPSPNPVALEIADDLDHGLGLKYSQLFQNNPTSAVQLLRKFHTSKASGRIYLSDALGKFLTTRATTSDWTALIFAGLLNAIVEIASDRSIYTDCFTNRTKLMYVCNILLILRRFATILNAEMGQHPFHGSTKYLLENCDTICHLLWNHRLMMRPSPHRKPDLDCSGPLSSFVLSVMTLKESFHTTPQPPIVHSVHLLLTCWCLGEPGLEWTHHLTTKIIDLLGDDAGAKIKVVMGDPSVQPAFLRTLHFLCCSKTLVDDFLFKIFLFACMCSGHEPSLQKTMLTFRHDDLSLMEALSMACQRQFCYGDHSLTKKVSYAFLKMFQICRFKTYHPEPPLLETWYRNIDLWALVSQIILIEGEGRDGIPIINMGIDILEDDLIFLKMTAGNTLDSPYSHQLRAVLGKVIPLMLNTFIASDISRNDPRYELVRQYRTVIESYGMDIEGEHVAYYPGYETHYHSCHYPNCMCSHKRPLHPLRVCKGCWSVFYCGAPCQAMDWTSGHRDVCLAYQGKEFEPTPTYQPPPVAPEEPEDDEDDEDEDTSDVEDHE